MPAPVNRTAPEKPGGEIIKFFLSANSQYKKGECITLRLNGYEYPVTVGAKNELPEDVLKMLESNESKTVVPDFERYDPERGGIPRAKEDFYRGAKKFHYVKDFDIERL
jgi:hypothetical protein